MQGWRRSQVEKLAPGTPYVLRTRTCGYTQWEISSVKKNSTGKVVSAVGKLVNPTPAILKQEHVLQLQKVNTYQKKYYAWHVTENEDYEITSLPDIGYKVVNGVLLNREWKLGTTIYYDLQPTNDGCLTSPRIVKPQVGLLFQLSPPCSGGILSKVVEIEENKEGRVVSFQAEYLESEGQIFRLPNKHPFQLVGVEWKSVEFPTHYIEWGTQWWSHDPR